MRKVPGEPGIENEYVMTERDVLVLAALVDRTGLLRLRFASELEERAVIRKLNAWAAEICQLNGESVPSCFQSREVKP